MVANLENLMLLVFLPLAFIRVHSRWKINAVRGNFRRLRCKGAEGDAGKEDGALSFSH
jgi:hypothetical protein